MGEEEKEDSVDNYEERFQDRHIRHRFIKYVYLILAGVECFSNFTTSISMDESIYEKLFVYLVRAIAAVMFLLICVEPFRKTSPINFITLFIFTALKGFLLAFIVVYYPNDEVLLALGCTAALCTGLTIFAFQTKWDFTACWAVFLCGLIILIFMCFISAYFNYKFDIQMIKGEKTKLEIEPDDYILGAINLYLDIVLIIFYILELY